MVTGVNAVVSEGMAPMIPWLLSRRVPLIISSIFDPMSKNLCFGAPSLGHRLIACSAAPGISFIAFRDMALSTSSA